MHDHTHNMQRQFRVSQVRWHLGGRVRRGRSSLTVQKSEDSLVYKKARLKKRICMV